MKLFLEDALNSDKEECVRSYFDGIESVFEGLVWGHSDCDGLPTNGKMLTVGGIAKVSREYQGLKTVMHREIDYVLLDPEYSYRTTCKLEANKKVEVIAIDCGERVALVMQNGSEARSIRRQLLRVNDRCWGNALIVNTDVLETIRTKEEEDRKFQELIRKSQTPRGG